MRICIPCRLPGGPDGALAESFESMEVMDYYESGADGLTLMVQTFSCVVGACIDPVEAVIARDVDTVVVLAISRQSRMRLQNAGVGILHTRTSSVREALRDVSKDFEDDRN